MTRLDELFWSRVEKRGDCMIWVGHIDKWGYGIFKHGFAHRYAYKTKVGPLIDGLCIDHLCRVTACVNPKHLEQVTMAENNLRNPFTASSINRTKTVCVAGHPFSEANTYRWKRGRKCKPCTREASERYKLKKELEAKKANG